MHRSYVARLFDPDAPAELSFPALAALCEGVAERTGDPFAGLALAAALPPGSYGVVEYVAANAATVGDAIALLVKFQPLVSELAHTNVVRANRTVTFEHWIDHPVARDAVQLNEFSLATYLRLGHVRLGFRPRFVAVRFMHDRPARRAQLEAHFGAPVTFGAARNALVIDAAVLARPMAQPDARLFAILAERAERDLARVQPPTSTACALAVAYRSLLVTSPHRAQVFDAARAVGTSVRSLHRRLAAEGTSFRAIEADVKRALANEYLADTQQPIERIASVLGFANPSAFIRAYKRWTGKTPRSVRVARIGHSLA